MRPAGIGRQAWRDLVFLHWPYPPEAIRPLVPAPLQLDAREGTAWVGIVAFRIEGLRYRRLPFRLGFLETNVRTYVTLSGEPAIWFFALDAASPLAVMGARAAYRLPYHRARMWMKSEGKLAEYGHDRIGEEARFRVGVQMGAPLGPATPGTLEHFLVERYRFHVVRRGRVWTTEVRHRPYPLRAAAIESLEETLLAASRIPPPRGSPLVHASEGVDVEILATRR
ncbi:MAG: YqjF family protein [Gemmatimonadota bacterium]